MFLAQVHVTHINTIFPKVTNSSTQAALLFCFIPWNTRMPWELGKLTSPAMGLGAHGHLHARPGATHLVFWSTDFAYMEIPPAL